MNFTRLKVLEAADKMLDFQEMHHTLEVADIDYYKMPDCNFEVVNAVGLDNNFDPEKDFEAADNIQAVELDNNFVLEDTDESVDCNSQDADCLNTAFAQDNH